MRPFASIWLALALVPPASADDPAPRSRVHIDRITIDDAFPDAYQVEVADVDGDGKPDLVALGGATIAWYQNPTWTKRIIATGGDPLKADIISSSTVDLDGDGKAEIAIACDFAMNTPMRGELFLAVQGPTLDASWTIRKIADVPSIHRVRWADLEGDKKPELIVAPIFGPKAKPPIYDQDPARIVEFRLDPNDPKNGVWTEREVLRRPVVHAIEVVSPRPVVPGARIARGLQVANNTGVTVATALPDQNGLATHWDVEDPHEPMIPGAMGIAPRKGASEVHLSDRFVATIEPWHGSEVVIWREPNGMDELAEQRKRGIVSPFVRTVIDATLDDGHALWTADVDGDGADEIFAGHRGKDHRVAMYRFNGTTWDRTVIDTAIAAQDLRGGDLDADGVPDVVAVGGKTHNVVWYRPSRLAKPAPAGVAR